MGVKGWEKVRACPVPDTGTGVTDGDTPAHTCSTLC